MHLPKRYHDAAYLQRDVDGLFPIASRSVCSDALLFGPPGQYSCQDQECNLSEFWNALHGCIVRVVACRDDGSERQLSQPRRAHRWRDIYISQTASWSNSSRGTPFIAYSRDEDMATEDPSTQRLQALVNDIRKPGYSLKVISPESTDDVLEAARLLEEVWSEHEPICNALLSNSGHEKRGIQQRFRQFCQDTCRLSSQHSLLLAVVLTQSSKLVGLMIGMPCTPDVYPELALRQEAEDPMAPLFDILHQLDNHLNVAVNQLDSDSKSSIKLLDFFGAAITKLHSRQHLVYLLAYAMARIGLELGFTNGICKVSSPWQRVITTQLGWQFLGEVPYHDYEFKGRKPFKTIPAPAAVQLAWNELKSVQHMLLPRL